MILTSLPGTVNIAGHKLLLTVSSGSGAEIRRGVKYPYNRSFSVPYNNFQDHMIFIVGISFLLNNRVKLFDDAKAIV